MNTLTENFDNLIPRLARRLKSLDVSEYINIDNLSSEEFENYWNKAKINISPNAKRDFERVLEKAQALQRLEKARQGLKSLTTQTTWLHSAKDAIAALPLKEVIRRLCESTSMPGVNAAVYARKLEETTEEDLRSLLLDQERLNYESAIKSQSPGSSI